MSQVDGDTRNKASAVNALRYLTETAASAGKLLAHSDSSSWLCQSMPSVCPNSDNLPVNPHRPEKAPQAPLEETCDGSLIIQGHLSSQRQLLLNQAGVTGFLGEPPL